MNDTKIDKLINTIDPDMYQCELCKEYLDKYKVIFLPIAKQLDDCCFCKDCWNSQKVNTVSLRNRIIDIKREEAKKYAKPKNRKVN